MPSGGDSGSTKKSPSRARPALEVPSAAGRRGESTRLNPEDPRVLRSSRSPARERSSGRASAGDALSVGAWLPNAAARGAAGAGGGPVEYSELEMGEELGRGSFAVVYRARLRGDTCCVKVHRESVDTNNALGALKELELFRREAMLMQRLRHKNVVELYGFCLKPRALVMEFCQNGSLYAILHDSQFEPLLDTLAACKKFATGICAGMAHLHEHGVVHRDLRTENVFIAFPPASKVGVRVKVGDFNLSREVSASSLTMTECGTFQWIAPETVREEHASEMVDVYSFAMVLWEIATREVPFTEVEGGPWFASLQAAFHGLRPSLEHVRHREHFEPLITSCWVDDHHARPTFKRLKQRLRKIPGGSLKEALELLPEKARRQFKQGMQATVNVNVGSGAARDATTGTVAASSDAGGSGQASPAAGVSPRQ